MCDRDTVARFLRKATWVILFVSFVGGFLLIYLGSQNLANHSHVDDVFKTLNTIEKEKNGEEDIEDSAGNTTIALNYGPEKLEVPLKFQSVVLVVAGVAQMLTAPIAAVGLRKKSNRLVVPWVVAATGFIFLMTVSVIIMAVSFGMALEGIWVVVLPIALVGVGIVMTDVWGHQWLNTARHMWRRGPARSVVINTSSGHSIVTHTQLRVAGLPAWLTSPAMKRDQSGNSATAVGHTPGGGARGAVSSPAPPPEHSGTVGGNRQARPGRSVSRSFGSRYGS